MHIHSSLILLVALFFVFTPTLEQWLLDGSAAWYRPQLVWLAVIVFVYLSQRGRRQDEL